MQKISKIRDFNKYYRILKEKGWVESKKFFERSDF